MALRGTISAANSTGSTTGINVSLTSGWTGSPPVSGDIIIAELEADITSGTFTITNSTFSAIPSLSNMNIAEPLGTVTFGAQYQVYNGSDTTMNVKVSATSHFYSVILRAYSGRNSSPFTVTPTTNGPIAVAGPPVSVVLTALTANAGDDIVILVGGQQCAANTDTWTYTPPSGFANEVTSFAAATDSVVIHSCDQVGAAAGSTGTSGGTVATTSGLNVAYGVFVISLAQSGGPANTASIAWVT
jgi:hypothetical protein